MNRAEFIRRLAAAAAVIYLAPEELARAVPQTTDLGAPLGMGSASIVADSGLIPCDGRTIDAELYPRLFEVIGDLYGQRTPDFRGRIVA